MRYPIELALPHESLGPEVRERDRVCLLQSPRSFATAKVRIDGRDLFFRYFVGPDTTEIDLRALLPSLVQAWPRERPPIAV